MAKLEPTGERYLPDMTVARISYEHWHRYCYALPYVKNKIVLDIACGEGYGCDLLSRQANKVAGEALRQKNIRISELGDQVQQLEASLQARKSKA